MRLLITIPALPAPPPPISVVLSASGFVIPNQRFCDFEAAFLWFAKALLTQRCLPNIEAAAASWLVPSAFFFFNSQRSKKRICWQRSGLIFVPRSSWQRQKALVGFLAKFVCRAPPFVCRAPHLKKKMLGIWYIYKPRYNFWIWIWKVTLMWCQ